MTEGTGRASVFRSVETKPDAAATPEIRIFRPLQRWDPENFANEQIRGLVRQVFFSNARKPVRQIVISPVESQTDVQGLCRRVGHALALETTCSVAVVCAQPLLAQVLSHEDLAHDFAQQDPAQNDPLQGDSGTRSAPCQSRDSAMPVRRMAIPIRSNLWLVQALAEDGGRISDSRWHAYLCELRAGFEYSIVEGPPAAESSEATAMAQLADGIILVLSARYTRRATALDIKKRLEAGQARILGTVLSDRNFPIPESIYRRL